MADAKPATASNCQLASAHGDIQHVIYIQFDNVHFTRDNPNVPSDLEQMPHLLNFLTGNGVLLDNHHTPLISHTGNDILTSITGLYGSDHGGAVANSYRYFNPDGTTASTPVFAYWTDLIGNRHIQHDHSPQHQHARAMGALHQGGLQRGRRGHRQYRA